MSLRPNPRPPLRLVPARAASQAGPDLPGAEAPAAAAGAAAPRLRPLGRPQGPERRPLGQILLESGAVAPGDLMKAVALRERHGKPLAEVLRAHGWVSEADLAAAQALQWGLRRIDPVAEPPDPRLVDRLGAAECLARGLLPWRRAGGAVVIGTARPADFAAERPALEALFGPLALVLTTEEDIGKALLGLRRTGLVRRAEARVPLPLSCRGHDAAGTARRVFLGLAALGAALLLAPVATLLGLLGWTLLCLTACTLLKIAALAATVRAARPGDGGSRRPPGQGRVLHFPAPAPGSHRLPVVSIMVPLFREKDIAARLVRRLGRLDYPRELLDILLVVEEEDATTRAALSRSRLPVWMRIVTVPRGPVKTKPRALNFALNFCRGEIVGIYDAEDAPEPQQIHRIVRRFAEAGPEVVCLQGILDFYNPRTNWLARCFTIEYASWFRVVLPGVARLGLVVPLGGTTLFIRRAAVEALGGWDAHNVTEDADLGMRIARAGWRTELIEAVTEEEANCRPVPWVKQRSRWQKGYAMTWGVHMRHPLQLWREIGPWRFLGFQAMFLGSVSQAMMAPLLWSFWLLALALPHPLATALPERTVPTLTLIFLVAEAVNLICGLYAVRGDKHRHLRPWVVTLHLYNLLLTFSAWKAAREILTKPFYWDKTQHGVFDRTTAPAAEPAAAPRAGSGN